MRKTKSSPIQFRLLLDDYAVLETVATEAGMTPKDFVIDMTLRRVRAERKRISAKRKLVKETKAATSA